MKLFALAKQKVVTFLQKAQEGEMSIIQCPACTNGFNISTSVTPAHADFEFLGSITCKKESVHEQHSFPIKFIGGKNRANISFLPTPHSVNALGAIVKSTRDKKDEKDKTVREILVDREREDLVQDITEACSAKLWELYKSSVVMCRRIVQIPLAERLVELKKDDVERAIKGGKINGSYSRLGHLTLGPLLDIERNLESRLLSNLQREQAKKIKELGDDGAHNRADLEPDDVDGNIREAAIIAASLVYQMKMPASESQSEKDSNEP